MDRCVNASNSFTDILLFWGPIKPLLIAVAIIGGVWVYLAAVTARWPSCHVLAIIGAMGFFGGVSPADRYWVHPATHLWVLWRVYHKRKKQKHLYKNLSLISISLIISISSTISYFNGSACDGAFTKVSLGFMVASGILVDRSFSLFKYYALLETTAVFLLIAADPLELDSRVSHFTWWGLVVFAIFSLSTVLGYARHCATTALCVSSAIMCGTITMSAAQCTILHYAFKDNGATIYIVGNFFMHYYPFIRVLLSNYAQIPTPDTLRQLLTCYGIIVAYCVINDPSRVYGCIQVPAGIIAILLILYSTLPVIVLVGWVHISSGR